MEGRDGGMTAGCREEEWKKRTREEERFNLFSINHTGGGGGGGDV